MVLWNPIKEYKRIPLWHSSQWRQRHYSPLSRASSPKCLDVTTGFWPGARLCYHWKVTKSLNFLCSLPLSFLCSFWHKNAHATRRAFWWMGERVVFKQNLLHTHIEGSLIGKNKTAKEAWLASSETQQHQPLVWRISLAQGNYLIVAWAAVSQEKWNAG